MYSLLYNIVAKFTIAPLVLKVFVKKIEGIENIPEGGAIIASNHASHLDPLIIASICALRKKRKLHYLGKKELFEGFIGNFVQKTVGTIPIDRDAKGKAALKTAGKYLKKDKLVGIFPEGTRSLDGKIQKGKTGVARLVLEAEVPVVPTMISGTFKLMPKTKKFPSLKRIVIVKFGRPTYFNEYYKKPMTKKLLINITESIMDNIKKLIIATR